MAKKNKLPVAPSTSYPCDVPTKAYKPSKEDQARQRRYAAEDGLRAIQRAEEIKKDKQCMADIRSLAKEQMNNLKKFSK